MNRFACDHCPDYPVENGVFMATILIIEGNTPDMVAAGHAGANGFIGTLAALSPDTRVRIANPYAKPVGNDDLRDVDGVIFTGSGVNWPVDAAEGAPQRAAMEIVLASGRPIWGSCNGLQLAMHVLGGTVGASPAGMEVGMALDISLTKAGSVHPMMAGRAPGFGAPCIHRDEVQLLPDGAVLLAGNGHSPVQSVAYERAGIRFWGTQYHPELSSRDIGIYVRDRGIFSDHIGLAEDLEAADSNEAAAARLGSHPDDIVLPARSRELVNWLQFVTGG